MPTLENTLSLQDIGYLHIVAELWGCDLTPADLESGASRLADCLLQPDLMQEMLEMLPPESRQALLALASNNDKMPWDVFTRRYGPLREMGPGKRDREMPFLAPISSTEVLFYHGLLGRSFLPTPEGPQEFAYVPDEIGQWLRQNLPDAPQTTPPQTTNLTPGRPARTHEHQFPQPGDDSLLEDAVTLLAARRMGWEKIPFSLKVSPHFIEGLLQQIVILQTGQPQPQAVKTFLESPRPQIWVNLVQTWLQSDMDDLCMTPNLQCEGEWQHDPVAARQTILAWVQALPANTWWSLNGFIEAIHREQPDFQRSGGEYEAWFIKSAESGQYLRGFDHWQDVEGAFLRYFISGPLHWLGLVDLAAPAEGQPAAAFRLSEFAQALLQGEAPSRPAAAGTTLHISARGKIFAPKGCSLALRYQISRFCDWIQAGPDGYTYRLTPHSLKRAEAQGLTARHLLALLKKQAAPLPPNLQKALARWEKHGSEARLQTVTILQVQSPQILKMLQGSRAARFLGKTLNPTTVIIQNGAEAPIMEALSEMGIFTEESHSNQND